MSSKFDKMDKDFEKAISAVALAVFNLNKHLLDGEPINDRRVRLCAKAVEKIVRLKVMALHEVDGSLDLARKD